MNQRTEQWTDRWSDPFYASIGVTDRLTDGWTDGRTDRPSYGDAFLMDASKKSLRMFSDTIPVADGGTLDMHYRINDAHVDTFLHLSTMER